MIASQTWPRPSGSPSSRAMQGRRQSSGEVGGRHAPRPPGRFGQAVGEGGERRQQVAEPCRRKGPHGCPGETRSQPGSQRQHRSQQRVLRVGWAPSGTSAMRDHQQLGPRGELRGADPGRKPTGHAITCSITGWGDEFAATSAAQILVAANPSPGSGAVVRRTWSDASWSRSGSPVRSYSPHKKRPLRDGSGCSGSNRAVNRSSASSASSGASEELGGGGRAGRRSPRRGRAARTTPTGPRGRSSCVPAASARSSAPVGVQASRRRRSPRAERSSTSAVRGSSAGARRRRRRVRDPSPIRDHHGDVGSGRGRGPRRRVTTVVGDRVQGRPGPGVRRRLRQPDQSQARTYRLPGSRTISGSRMPSSAMPATEP